MYTTLLHPIIEQDSENHMSKVMNGQEDYPQTYKENAKRRIEPQQYEKIFSDTDESSSRMNDSLLDHYWDPKDRNYHQRQFSQSVLDQFQNLKEQQDERKKLATDQTLNLTLDLTKSNNFNSQFPKGNLASTYNQDKSMNQSLFNIVKELNAPSKLNDTQVVNQKYQETLQMMSQLQKELNLKDSLQASQQNNNGSRPINHSQIYSSYQQNQINSIPSNSIQQTYQNQQAYLNNYSSAPIQTSTILKQSNNIKNTSNNGMRLNSPNAHDSIQATQTQIRSSSLNTPQTLNNTLNHSSNTNSEFNSYKPSKFTVQNSQSTTLASPLLANIQTPSTSTSPFQSYQNQNSQWLTDNSQVKPYPLKNQPNPLFNQQQKDILFQTELSLKRNSVQEDPFQRQKRMEQQLLSQRNYEKMLAEELPIFCINCEEYISLVQMDKHSENECETFQKRKKTQNPNQRTNAQNQYYLAPKGESIDQINEKITQIEFQLQDRLQKSKPQEQYSIIQLMEKVLQSARQLKQNTLNGNKMGNELNAIRESRQQINFIKSNNQQGNIGTIILWDRLILLGEEKEGKMRLLNNNFTTDSDYQRERENEIQMVRELKNLDLLTEQEQEKVKFWKSQSQMIEAVKKQDIQNLEFVRPEKIPAYQIAHNFQSEKDSESIYSTGTYSTPTELFSKNRFNGINQGVEDKKKQFFSLALNLKFKLPPNHPGKGISMQDLFEQSQRQQIPQSQWQEFIRQKINSM